MAKPSVGGLVRVFNPLQNVRKKKTSVILIFNQSL